MTTPEAFGRYQIKDELGRGGMAIVYHAHDQRFNRSVALKILPREFLFEHTFRARFDREAQAIAALEHWAIVPVYDYGEQDDQPFLVMRYMPGGSLLGRIAGGGLPLGEVIPIVDRIAAALDFAHRKNIIHRDVKPANILFDDEGDAYLSDFGIARLAESTMQLTGSGFVGTPTYVAPEMMHKGGVTPLVDVYALGVTLYQVLAGKPPYEGDTPMGTALAHATQPIPDIVECCPGLPGAIQTVIEGALAKDPADRYQSAGALADGLREVAMHTRPNLPIVEEAALIEPPDEPTIHETAPPAAFDITLLDAPPDELMAIQEPTSPIPPAARAAASVHSIPSLPAAQPDRREFPLWAVGALGLVVMLGLIGLGFAIWPRGGGAVEGTEGAVQDSPTAVSVLSAPPQGPTPTLIPTPMAEILEFTASPTEVTYRTDGSVTLAWRTENQVSISISDENGAQLPLSVNDLSTGRYEIPVADLAWGEHTYQLTIVGDDNIRRSHSVMITVNSLRCAVDLEQAEVFTRPNDLSMPAPDFESNDLVILGRNEDGSWLWVGYNDLSAPEWNEEGWVQREQVDCPPGTPFDRYILVDQFGIPLLPDEGEQTQTPGASGNVDGAETAPGG
jgi:serine/threonine protein kinase